MDSYSHGPGGSQGGGSGEGGPREGSELGRGRCLLPSHALTSIDGTVGEA